ncbi:MAG: translation initiation factor IF-3 [Fidelibacterota bacterium]
MGDSPIAKKNKQRLNNDITSDEVRLISETGEQLGVVTLEAALERAQDVGLDLMEVGPGMKPPVCKIVDYGKLKYEEKKKQQQSKKKQHVVKLKEIRLRPRIDDHDLMTKLNRGRKFLEDGAKLKITLMFRGRELARIDLGKLVMDRVLEELADVAEVEKNIPLEGRRMSIILNAK